MPAVPWLLSMLMWAMVTEWAWTRCIHDDIASTHRSTSLSHHKGTESDAENKPSRGPRDVRTFNHSDVVSNHGDTFFSHSDDLFNPSDRLLNHFNHSDGLYNHSDGLYNHSDGLYNHSDGLFNHSEGAVSTSEEEEEAEYRPLRVHVHHEDSPLLSDDRQDMVKTAVHMAVLRVQSVLSVVPVTGPLLLPRTACSVVIRSGRNKGKCSKIPKAYSTEGEVCLGIYKIPEAHLAALSLHPQRGAGPVKEVVGAGSGVKDADLIVYVMARNTRQCLLEDRTVVAFASHCRVDRKGRPIAGLVNFCPSAVMRSTVTHRLLYTTALHELLHVLGFSAKLFRTFLDCTGGKCKKGEYLRPVKHDLFRLTSPTVVSKSQQHFGCHSDQYFGGPLQAKYFEATSHWHPLLMHTSVMTAEGENVSYPVLDPITLAVFEDSGWYRVNFSNADLFLWGKDAGCVFANKGHCQQNQEHFCSDNSSGCHFLLRDKAVCDAFTTHRHCGVYVPGPQGSCTQNITDSQEGSTEIYSPSSRCFLSSVATALAQDGQREEFRGQCYQRWCSENGTVFIRLQGTEWIPCPQGQHIQVSGLTGEIQCPNNSDVLCMEDFSFPSKSSDSWQQDEGTSPTGTTVTTTILIHTTHTAGSPSQTGTTVSATEKTPQTMCCVTDSAAKVTAFFYDCRKLLPIFFIYFLDAWLYGFLSTD
ncbi:ciliated left-right organizer metallopeptidase-like [Babylonia areolata]|uniref:ciliated left-right organizer metallopeptidase-like n=1 Tax=Babylonia areolata TaxID=304850 RepID=UPI003FD43A98